MTEFVMDRVAKVLGEMCKEFEILLQQMEIYRQKESIPEDLLEATIRLYERTADVIILAKGWRLVAKMNGIELDDTDDE